MRSKPYKKNPEDIVRHGLKNCGVCRKKFTVRIGTILEHSHIPLHMWLQAFHLMCSSKKHISSHQLHRILEIKYQSAWFMSPRIRGSMCAGSFETQMGDPESSIDIVEADETYIGRKKDVPKRRGAAHKHAVLSLVERNS